MARPNAQSTSEQVRDKGAPPPKKRASFEHRGFDPTSLNKGGKVPGKGNKDTVLAKLTPGEVVVRKGPAKANAGMLRRLNQGGSTRYRSG